MQADSLLSESPGSILNRMEPTLILFGVVLLDTALIDFKSDPLCHLLLGLLTPFIGRKPNQYPSFLLYWFTVRVLMYQIAKFFQVILCDTSLRKQLLNAD